MSEDIYLVYEQYEDSERINAIYDTAEEANKHAKYISEESSNLDSWVEERELKWYFDDSESDDSVDTNILDVLETMAENIPSRDIRPDPQYDSISEAMYSSKKYFENSETNNGDQE